MDPHRRHSRAPAGVPKVVTGPEDTIEENTAPGNHPPTLVEHVVRRRAEFADTDLAGIVHFARFFVFMETAEHELLRALGLEVDAEVGGVRLGWPRVSAECEYRRPVRFGEEVEIRVRVVHKGRTSLTFEHTFFRDGEVVAVGRVTSVCCELGAPGGPRPVPIPDRLADRLR